jgi:signal transduction histidine kinase
MLAQGAVAAERRANALDIIGRNARLQAQLVDDLLDVSRITTGNLRLDHQPFSIATVVEAAIESFRPVAAAKGIHLVVAASENDPVMTGDPTRVQQIVSNLLSNGIKFTPAGGHVVVEVFNDDLKTHIRVRDTGPGIAPELLPHVFERFRQGDSSPTRAHSGLGLGLAIAQHLVERHGGTIEAHSEGAGKGTEFVVQFPRQASNALHNAA